MSDDVAENGASSSATLPADTDTTEKLAAVEDLPVATVAEPDAGANLGSETSSVPDAVTSDVVAMQAEIDSLKAEVAREASYADKKAQLLEQALTELDFYKKGEPENKLRAVLMELIGLYDDLQGIIARSDLADEHPMKRSLMAFEKGIIETLARSGVKRYQEEGDAYNRESQRPLQSVPTEDPARDMTIAQRVRAGFRLDGRVLRPEIVDVYRYQQPQ